MKREDIVPNRVYAGRGNRDRLVVAVERDVVTYTVQGMFSVAPLRITIAAFAAWAEQFSDDLP